MKLNKLTWQLPDDCSFWPDVVLVTANKQILDYHSLCHFSPLLYTTLKMRLLQQDPEGSHWGRWQEPSKGLMLPTTAHPRNKKKQTAGMRPAGGWKPGTEQPPLHHTENILSLPPWFAKLHWSSWSNPSGLSQLQMFLKGQTYKPSPASPGSGCLFLFINAISKIKSTFYSLTNNYSFQEGRWADFCKAEITPPNAMGLLAMKLHQALRGKAKETHFICQQWD